MYGSNFGTKIIVTISANTHFKKDMRLKKKPLTKHCKEKTKSKS